jgi:uncharacterized RDD family membrane protein YckC
MEDQFCGASYATPMGQDVFADDGAALRRNRYEEPPGPDTPVAWTADDLSDVWTRAIGYGVDAVLLAAAGVVVYFGIAFIAPIWVMGRFDLVLGTIFMVLLVVYTTVLVGATGRTIGHSLLHLMVVRTSGHRVSYGRAFLRWVGYVLCTLTLFLGFAVAIADKKRQGLHDKLADTVVIGERASLATRLWATIALLAIITLGVFLLRWMF